MGAAASRLPATSTLEGRVTREAIEHRPDMPAGRLPDTPTGRLPSMKLGRRSSTARLRITRRLSSCTGPVIITVLDITAGADGGEARAIGIARYEQG